MSKAAERLRTLSPERLALLEKMRQQERAAAARPAPEAPPETPRFSLISAADRALLPDDVEDAYPLTNMQAGMLYHMELSPDYLIYQDVESKRLPGRIDFELFHRAVAKVVARHDLLRTGLERTRYGEPLQLVHARAEMPIAVEDLRSLPASEQDAAIAAYAREEKRRAFEYAKPPLLRLMFHLLEDDRFQLTVTMCHPIMDGWSLNTCWLEISAHYAALVEGRDLPVEPPPPVAYRDFVALERQATASPATRAFWDQVLAGSPGLELPRWPAPFRERGGIPVTTRKIAIPGGDFLAAKAMTQRAGLSIKSALLAVHAKVLSTLTGLDDVLAGLTTHGRPERTGGDRILGLFFNTVPIRLRLDPGSWLDLSRRAFEAEQALMPHRRYPLGLLQQKWGRRTLLETSFNMTHFHHTKGSAPRPAARDEALGNIDLEENDFLLSTTFTIDPSDDSLSLVFACHRSAICREQFELLLGWYRRALAALGSDPGAPHEAFSPLSPPERQQALLEWNDTSAREEPLTLDQLFFARAAETPGAIAVAFEGEEVTYLSLAERAERLAGRLRAEGVGPEVRVAIALERSIEMLVALLGVLRAGGAYVPLDPAYPRDRIAYVLGDAGAALLLAEAPLRQRLPELDGIKALTSAEWRDEPAAPASPTGGARPRPDNLAYVLYTSGSTGRPKGVEVTHRGVVNFLAAMQELLRLGPDDRLLAVTTLSFDIAGLELYLPLATGGRVEIASRATAADGVRLARALRETDATAMQATPATWAMLLESGWRGDRGLLMLCGGEALPRPLAERLLPCGRALWNLYGPTETTIWSAARRVTLGEGAVPIGRPIANNQLVVLDSKLQPAPIATPGELMIGGSGLARGYHGRPDLTAERFVPSPAATAEPGARLYRTGDLARLSPDGEIEFLGRADHQIKVRGFRIELGEIEACLLAHPALGQAAVAARDDGSGTRLVAYVVARSEPPPARELRAFLLEKLPDYMVPALFVPLPELPLTPNGKVDRKALPVPEADRAALAASYVAPRTETEARAAALWAELLGLPRVGIEDPFFELGGHSLLAMQLVLKLREAFAVDLPLQSLFEQPTVAGLAAEIDRRRGEAAASFPALALPELVPDPASAGEPFPLTDLQQAYWIGSGGALELGNVSAHTYQELA
ncbi:MAG TPA: amino acid adenylation domain-containing protein, partial [Thermoanaerobaculia bacterium]|nr:amino acid adenylation domain-containing protein [Thermoanaerobaculia bacterium]